MKYIFLFIALGLSLILSSCADMSQNPTETVITSKESVENQPYKVFYTLDTLLCDAYTSSFYVGVLKVNNQIVDTVDLVNPPIILGEGKFIYVKVSADAEVNKELRSDSSFMGNVSAMKIYDHGKISEINPPNIYTYFSSWTVYLGQLYYTTFSNKQDKVFNYINKYDLATHKLIRTLNYNEITYGTDARCPQGYLLTHGDSIEIIDKWEDLHGNAIVIDTNLTRVIKKYKF